MSITDSEKRYYEQQNRGKDKTPNSSYSGDWTSSGAKPIRHVQFEDSRPDMTDEQWAKKLLSEILAAGITLPEELKAGQTTFSREQLIKMMATRD